MDVTFILLVCPLVLALSQRSCFFERKLEILPLSLTVLSLLSLFSSAILLDYKINLFIPWLLSSLVYAHRIAD